MGQVLVLALTASLNPTLLAATTMMLLLDHPSKLMLGYLLGALMTSVTLGLVIVFSLSGSSAAKTTQHSLSPALDLALGGLALVLAYVVHAGHVTAAREQRRERKAAKPDKGPPRWQRELSKGSPRTTFVIGALLSLPGASYLAGLDRIHKLGYSSTGTVAGRDRLQPSDDVDALGADDQLRRRARCDATGDRACAGVGWAPCPHVRRPRIFRDRRSAHHQGRDRVGVVSRYRVA